MFFARTILDGTEGGALDKGAVIVEGERIAAIGSRKKLERLAKNARVVDAQALTALPGLINVHAHLDSDCGPDFVTSALLMSEQQSTLLAADSARRSLLAGVTTLRDLGNKYAVAIALRDAIQKGWVSGPRILAAGKIICMTGGHCWFIGHESDGPGEMRKAVRQNLKIGADCIKVIATGGVISPGVEVGHAQLDADELTVAVSEAHKAGRRVAAHAIGNSGIKNSLRAGVDTIEHGCYLDDEAIALFKKSGATFVPTLCAPHFLHRNIERLPDYAARKTREVYEAHRESFRLALRKGVTIASGTDAGTPYNLHAEYATEPELMTALGMPVEQAIEACTAVAATALGLRKDVGTLEEGKVADMIFVDGDPRRDITALRRVKMVVARGQLVRQAA